MDGLGSSTRVASWEWIDETLRAKRVLSLSEHFLFRPLECALPVPGFHEVKISMTNFPADTHERRLTLVRAAPAFLAI